MTGFTGAVGPAGPTGTTGPKGDAGPKGETGPKETPAPAGIARSARRDPLCRREYAAGVVQIGYDATGRVTLTCAATAPPAPSGNAIVRINEVATGTAVVGRG